MIPWDSRSVQGHEQVKREYWRMTGDYIIVTAYRVDQDTPVPEDKDRSVARPGDWVIEDKRGTRWVLRDSLFKIIYSEVV